METGHDKVQGTDYAYTLHGWIKGVNSNSLREDLDIGQDGLKLVSPSHANTYNAKDVYGYSLTYYEDRNNNVWDYKAINNVSGTPGDFIADVYLAGLPQTPDLFNGNIRRMTSSYLDGSAPGKSYAVKALLRDFTYDQLNRIESATANINLKPDGNEWVMAGSLLYKEHFTYDQNGNILKAQRNGDNTGSLAMDDLSYHYVSGTNKLDYVDDAISGDPYSGDISSQSPGNYDYDKIGNLVKDDAEGISNIEWTVYGKIKKIDFASARRELIFKYDASGNRVSKTVHDFVGDNLYTTTYYVRDAQGNVMATYNEMWNTDTDAKSLGLSEHFIYGAGRLGVVTNGLDLTSDSNTPLNTSNVQRTLGMRSYELINYLGNVMAVVSDRKIAAETTGDNLTDYFIGEVLSANEYYAFGSNMPGRSFTSSSYRYGFNGKENDLESGTQDYGMRIYNPALGKFLSVDPLTGEYPELTPYQFASNSPIWGIDRDGEEIQFATAVLGGLVDYLGQVADNYTSGKKNPWTDNIDLVSIAGSMADGFLTSGASIGRKMLVKGTATLIKNIVEVKTTEKGIKAKVETNVKTIVKNTATDLVTDAVTGAVASKAGKVIKKELSQRYNINGGTIAKATKKILRTEGWDVTRKVNNVIEKVSKDVVEKTSESAVEKVVQKASEPLINHIKTENSVDSKQVEMELKTTSTPEATPEAKQTPPARKYWMPSDGNMYNPNQKKD